MFTTLSALVFILCSTCQILHVFCFLWVHFLCFTPSILDYWYFWVSGSFPMSQFSVSGGQNVGASASVVPVNIQDWFPLGLIDLMSLLSKTLSRVFSKTTVQKHPFFDTQLSLQSYYHGHTWLLEKLISQSLCIHWAGFFYQNYLQSVLW